MTHQRCEALTLRSYPYSEAHLMAVFLTRESGQLRSIAYGPEREEKQIRERSRATDSCPTQVFSQGRTGTGGAS